MKTPNKTTMVALILTAGAFLLPGTASAESRQYQVAFTYSKAAPADMIYKDFRRTAQRACKQDSLMPLALRKAEAVCAKDLMDQAVEKLGRADVAALHQSRFAQVASR